MIVDQMSDSEIRPHDHAEPGFGGLMTPKGALCLTQMDVRAAVVATVATTTVTQTFQNPYDTPLEATYIFPLPPRAAISGFVLSVNGRQIQGELKERGAARQAYDQAITSGHRAAIAEQERPDVFTIRAGNIPPGESVSVELEMTEPLEALGGEVTWRFPLVVAPRYIPGVAYSPAPPVGSGTHPDTASVPDASRISPPTLLPGYPNPVRLSVEVEVDTGGPEIAGMRSSLHVVATKVSGHLGQVRLEPGERLNRDFILRWNLAGSQIQAGCVSAKSPVKGEQIVQVSLTPPARDTADRAPRDVVFVLDRSGSMDGWKMIAARRSVGRMIDSLAADDRFSVLAFDTVVDTLPDLGPTHLLQATNRDRYRAMEWLAKIEARGGTEMAQPLDQGARALGQAAAPGRQGWLVLVTDGQVGNEAQILASLHARFGKQDMSHVRVFTVGIDQAVNAGFLRRLAEFGGGACELLENEDRLDEVMERVHHAIDTPLLTQISLRIEGAQALEEVAPDRQVGLFPGGTLLLSGKVTSPLPPDPHLLVHGLTALGDPWMARLPIQPTTNPAPAKIWAKQRLATLEDRHDAGKGSRDALAKEITKVSLTYGVLCPFTAFVAVDKDEVIKDAGPLRQVTQPVEPVSGAPKGAMRSRVAMPQHIPAPVAPSAPGSFAPRAQEMSFGRGPADNDGESSVGVVSDGSAGAMDFMEAGGQNPWDAIAQSEEPAPQAVGASYEKAKAEVAPVKEDDAAAATVPGVLWLLAALIALLQGPGATAPSEKRWWSQIKQALRPFGLFGGDGLNTPWSAQVAQALGSMPSLQEGFQVFSDELYEPLRTWVVSCEDAGREPELSGLIATLESIRGPEHAALRQGLATRLPRGGLSLDELWAAGERVSPEEALVIILDLAKVIAQDTDPVTRQVVSVRAQVVLDQGAVARFG